MRVRVSGDLLQPGPDQLKVREILTGASQAPEIHSFNLVPLQVEVHKLQMVNEELSHLLRIVRKMKHSLAKAPAGAPPEDGIVEGYFEETPTGSAVTLRTRGPLRLEARLAAFSVPAGAMHLALVAAVKDSVSGARRYYDTSENPWREIHAAGVSGQ